MRDFQGFSGRLGRPEPGRRMPCRGRGTGQSVGLAVGDPPPRATRFARWTSPPVAGTRSATMARRCARMTVARPGRARHRHSQDLTRLQAVTPDVLVVLGGEGCVVRRSDDGGKTFHKMFVLAETSCPDRVAASYFVSPQVGYLLLRDGNVLRTSDSGQTFGRGTAIPGTPASSGGGGGSPADAIFTSPDAGIVFLAGSNAAYRTTDAGASWSPIQRSIPAPSPACAPSARRPSTPSVRARCCAPSTAARPGSGDPPAAPTRSPGSAVRRRTCACSRPTAATSCCGRWTAATPRRRSPPRRHRSMPPASPTPTARSRRARAGRPSSPTTRAATTSRSAATSPARSSSACGSGRRRASRSRWARAGSSPARPTTA